MMRLLFALGLGLGVPESSRVAPIAPVHQLIRDVVLDPAIQVHNIDVVGWPNLTTAIRFPDTFDASNVLCGQCDDLSMEDTHDANVHADRNWIIEKRVSEHAIHVRPANLPGAHNPAAAFATNIYVGLDGGHTINLALRLLQPEPGATGQALNADAVVTVRLPTDATFSGKLAEVRRRIYEDFDKEVAQKTTAGLLAHLKGKVKCRTISWRRPHRTDKIVVRLNQLCVSESDTPNYWVTFQVENRGDIKLYLEEAMLEPEGLAVVAQGTSHSLLEHEALGFGETTTGIALCGLQAQSPIPSSWRLRIPPLSAEQKIIEVSQLTF